MNLILVIVSAATAFVGAQTAGTPQRRPDPALAAELAQAVEALRPQLPMTQGPLTITAIEARGAELIFDMELPQDVDSAFFERFRAELPAQACANSSVRQLFERGGSYTYRLRDAGGETFTTSISNC